MKFLVIGGSDAGISAALRARELNASVNITVVLADQFPNFSICGLPFYLSGEVSEWQRLAHRTEFAGIDLRLRHTARSIDCQRKAVELLDNDSHDLTLPYDRLLIATGAAPIFPEISGMNFPGVYALHTMDDAFRIQQRLNKDNPKTAVITGAGYIGVEMADALTRRGLAVTLVGRARSVLETVDLQFGQLVADELHDHDVEVHTNVEVQRVEKAGCLKVVGSNGFEKSADMVLIATGVRPSSELACSARIYKGDRGAIRVNESMQTNIPDIYAAGDCAETWHPILQRFQYLPLGTTSHKQGRVAGENAVGGNSRFRGSVGTQVVKVFNMVIGRTGLRDQEAKAAGFKARTVEIETYDHKTYYPGAQPLKIRVTGDDVSGRLLGAQILGRWGSEVAKRIDIFAIAIFHNISVEGISDLDLSYTPPVSSPWDPVQQAAQAWCQSR